MVALKIRDLSTYVAIMYIQSELYKGVDCQQSSAAFFGLIS